VRAVALQQAHRAAAVAEDHQLLAETVGLEGRGDYYEGAGALRDMVQNHMLQLLALVAMEPPSDFNAAAVRDEKVKVLRALRPINAQDVEQMTVTGQYTRGAIDGEPVPGFIRGWHRAFCLGWDRGVRGNRLQVFVKAVDRDERHRSSRRSGRVAGGRCCVIGVAEPGLSAHPAGSGVCSRAA